MNRIDFKTDVLIQGFPGKAVCHGGLGWSTVALIRGGDRIILVDVGSFGMRRMLIPRLAQLGIGLGDVTDVILTHSHYDHSVNWTLFPEARIWIGSDEIKWAVTVPPGPSPVPELYVRELSRSPQLHVVNEGDEILPGITAYSVPGHTPGHLVFLASGLDHDFLFVGDAAKNRAEILSRQGDMTLDAAVTTQSIERIWELWLRRPGTVLIPGHDIPMVLQNGQPKYIGKREAALAAWFGETLEQETIFELR
jgi:N-acyl homoserine lactone hydrolase